MATTEQVGSSVEQIPYVALEQLGKIFFEGQNKYGVGNWKDNPSPSYRLERLRHAIRHLFLFAEHDDTEKHLAKVLWFCVTELYLETKHGPLRAFSSRELYPDANHKDEPAPVGVYMETGQVVFDTNLNKKHPGNVVKPGTYIVDNETGKSITITEEKAKELNSKANSTENLFKYTVNATSANQVIMPGRCGTLEIGTNPNPSKINMQEFITLQDQFEAYKLASKKEVALLNEEITRLRVREYHG